jgi:hypothetical protein
VSNLREPIFPGFKHLPIESLPQAVLIGNGTGWVAYPKYQATGRNLSFPPGRPATGKVPFPVNHAIAFFDLLPAGGTERAIPRRPTSWRRAQAPVRGPRRSRLRGRRWRPRLALHRSREGFLAASG